MCNYLISMKNNNISYDDVKNKIDKEYIKIYKLIML